MILTFFKPVKVKIKDWIDYFNSYSCSKFCWIDNNLLKYCEFNTISDNHELDSECNFILSKTTKMYYWNVLVI